MVLGEKHGTNYLPCTIIRNSGTLIFVPFCRFVLSPAFQYNEAKEVEVCL